MANLPASIENGAVVFTRLSATKDRAEYRVEDPSIPPMYRRNLILTAKPNASGSNVNVAFKLVTPVITTVNGEVRVTNRRVLSGSYTSLQNVLDLSDGQDILDVSVLLVGLKAHFVNGSLH